jgi:glycosyltransferase involved in cell wall biosynthesis
VVHTHTAKAGFVGRLAARLAHTPCVVHHLHGSTFPPVVAWPLRRLYLSLERLAARWSDHIVPVGQDLMNVYRQSGVGRSDQYRVIHYAIDLQPFIDARTLTPEELAETRISLGVRPEEVVVGKIARLEGRKGFQYYIEAAERLAFRYDGLKFLIIGEGPDRERLEELVRRKGLESRVLFTGFRTDVERVMAALDIFAFTSLWEGLPQVMVQCASVGRPMVSFEVEGAREMIDHGLTGYVVPSRDVDSLVRYIEALYLDPVRRQEMGRRMREGFRPEEFHPDLIIERIEALYVQHLRQTRP